MVPKADFNGYIDDTTELGDDISDKAMDDFISEISKPENQTPGKVVELAAKFKIKLSVAQALYDSAKEAANHAKQVIGGASQ